MARKRLSTLSTVFLLVLAISWQGTSEVFGSNKEITIRDGANSKTISISKSTIIKIVLNSTYWSMSSSGSLEIQGQPIVVPIPPSSSAPGNCKFAGMGCGTVTWKFIANKTGTTEFVATRSSCGEALRCTESQKSFKVKFKIH